MHSNIHAVGAGNQRPVYHIQKMNCVQCHLFCTNLGWISKLLVLSKVRLNSHDCICTPLHVTHTHTHTHTHTCTNPCKIQPSYNNFGDHCLPSFIWRYPCIFWRVECTCAHVNLRDVHQMGKNNGVLFLEVSVNRG